MNKNTITIQFIDNGILFLYKKDINVHNISSVNNYKIINKKQFLKDMKYIFNKHNVDIENNKIIALIVDKTYSILELNIIKLIFRQLKYNKIEILDITDMMNLTLEEIAIDISENNMKIYYKENIYFSNIYFSKQEEILLIYLKKIIKLNNIKTIKVYGNNSNLEEIAKNIEQKTKIKTLIYAYPEFFPIKLLT